MAGEPTSSQRPSLLSYADHAADELGLKSLYASSIDVKILCLQRFIRLFGYGASTLALAPYLAELGTTTYLIGIFMTLTLVGDVVMSFILTLIADNLGRRRILALGSFLMSISGIIFALVGNYWVLLAAAVLGVITPSGNEIGPFRAVEESTIAHLTPSEHRNKVFAWYALLGTAGSALGLLISGWVTVRLTTQHSFTPSEAHRVVFLIYAVIGLLKLIMTCLLSSRCELEKQPKHASDEMAPLLADASTQETKPKKRSLFALLPELSAESRASLVQLCILFGLDSFASGLAPLSWVTYYFETYFDISEGQVGTIFFATSLIQAASILAAASIAARFGNIKTMVFTHLPSSICLALIGIPSSLPLAMALIILRASTQSMDTAPRTAFLSAVVLSHERTAVMGMINVVKTANQSLGPSITGILVGKKLFWVAFLMAGSLKAVYDIGLLVVFAGHKTREQREAEEEREEAAG